MKQEMHSNQCENSCRDVIKHNSSAFWKSLQLPNRRWLDDIERSEKYKTREKSFPRERDGDQCDQLPGDFVDHDKLWILCGRSSCHASGSGDADQRDQRGQGDGYRGSQREGQLVRDSGPDHHRGNGCPGPGSRTEAADSEKGCDHGCPERGAPARRHRDSRRDAGATVGRSPARG
jgi:hypothetical protein